MIQPIQTRYAGYLFRFRLEARWAVFFDRLKIPWEYEPQGFEVLDRTGDGRKWHYLPDFLLPKTCTWVEVKGELPNADCLDMLAWAVDWGGALPGISDTQGSSAGLLLLGPVPMPIDQPPLHVVLQHHKGIHVGAMRFTAQGPAYSGQFPGPRTWHDPDRYCDASCGDAGDKILNAMVEQRDENWVRLEPIDYRVYDAYAAARSARFERGQRGAQ
jgi:hypothetical protein